MPVYRTVYYGNIGIIFACESYFKVPNVLRRMLFKECKCLAQLRKYIGLKLLSTTYRKLRG